MDAIKLIGGLSEGIEGRGFDTQGVSEKDGINIWGAVVHVMEMFANQPVSCIQGALLQMKTALATVRTLLTPGFKPAASLAELQRKVCTHVTSHHAASRALTNLTFVGCIGLGTPLAV